jgi:hypothetical protein
MLVWAVARNKVLLTLRGDEAHSAFSSLTGATGNSAYRVSLGLRNLYPLSRAGRGDTFGPESRLEVVAEA